jgi:hypothetical protein
MDGMISLFTSIKKLLLLLHTLLHQYLSLLEPFLAELGLWSYLSCLSSRSSGILSMKSLCMASCTCTMLEAALSFTPLEHILALLSVTFWGGNSNPHKNLKSLTFPTFLHSLVHSSCGCFGPVLTPATLHKLHMKEVSLSPTPSWP